MKKLKYFLLVTFGSAILAFSVEAFNVSYDIAFGGTTGLSIIGNHLTHIDMSLISLILNLICLPIAWFFVGKKLAAGSVLASLLYPLFLSVFERIPGLSSFCHDLIVAVLASGVLSGLGIGLTMKAGASSGGTDILTVLISNLTKQSVGNVMYAMDACIMLCQLPFTSFDKVAYGIAASFLMTYTIDRVLDLGNEKMQITIISDKYEQIRKALVEKDFGVTLSYIQTGLDQKDEKSVSTTFRSSQRMQAEKIIHDIDPYAFVTVQRIMDVKGRGYTLEKYYKPVN